MFNDPDSSIYIPNKICEIITQILIDDREKFIIERFSRGGFQNSDLPNQDLIFTFKIFLTEIFYDVSQLRRQIHNEISFCKENVLALVNAAVAQHYESSVNLEEYHKKIIECQNIFNNVVPKIRKRYENEMIDKDNEIDILNKQITLLKKELSIS